MGNIMALSFLLKITLVLCYIVSFGFRSLMTNFLTLLLRDRLSFWNLDSVTLFFVLIIFFSIPHSFALLFIVSGALFLVGSHFMWYLDGVTLLPGFIPALVLPDSGAGGNTTVGATQKKQQTQNLHIC